MGTMEALSHREGDQDISSREKVSGTKPRLKGVGAKSLPPVAHYLDRSFKYLMKLLQWETCRHEIS